MTRSDMLEVLREDGWLDVPQAVAVVLRCVADGPLELPGSTITLTFFRTKHK